MAMSSFKQKIDTSKDRSSLKDDMEDVILAHKYRLTLKDAPKQSNFRVVSLVFYKLKDHDPSEILPNISNYMVHNYRDGFFCKKSIESRNERKERHYVVGANEEPCHMGGAICAERSALAQLRFVPNLDRVTKVVIATDAEKEIMPGMLCREFMASLVPWDTPIVLAGSVCSHCGLDITAASVWEQECGEVSAQAECSGVCYANFHNKCHPEISGMHNFLRRKVTVRDLYPHPSPYIKLSSKESVMLGNMFLQSLETIKIKQSEQVDQISKNFPNENEDYTDKGPEEIPYSENHSSKETEKDNTMEHLCASNCCTCPIRDKSSSAPHSQKYTESKHPEHYPTQNSSQKMLIHKKSFQTDNNKNMIQLLAKHLMQCAQEAALCDKKNLHPIKYGAAVFFSDGSIAQTHQKQSQEYGCTLDAVTQLAAFIEEKIEPRSNDEGRPKAILLVQCDQFGVAHAPFAEARAYLSEYGHDDVFVVLHDLVQERITFTNTDCKNEARKLQNTVDPELKIIKVRDLAPDPLGFSSEILNKTFTDTNTSRL